MYWLCFVIKPHYNRTGRNIPLTTEQSIKAKEKKNNFHLQQKPNDQNNVSKVMQPDVRLHLGPVVSKRDEVPKQPGNSYSAITFFFFFFLLTLELLYIFQSPSLNCEVYNYHPGSYNYKNLKPHFATQEVRFLVGTSK